MRHSHFVLGPHALAVHFVELEPFQIDPVDGAHVDGQDSLHEVVAGPFDVFIPVRNLNPARRTETVFGSLGPELVDGQVLAAAELDVLLGWIDP